MSRLTPPRDAKTFHRPERPTHVAVAREIRPGVTPGRDHKIRFIGKSSQPPVIRRTDWGASASQQTWGRRSKGEQIPNCQLSELQCFGESDATSNRSIIDIRVCRRGIEADEENGRKRFVPSTAECISVLPVA
jgi:hypothetical protein